MHKKNIVSAHAEQSVRVDSCFCGYHAHKNVCNPEIEDRLEAEVDKFSQHDRYAPGITENESTFRHISHEISKTCFYEKKLTHKYIHKA